MPDTSITHTSADSFVGSAAHPGFIARKVIASGKVGRAATVEACKAEVAWATRHGGHTQDWAVGIVDGWFTPPHLRAANAVLNAWSHLHPIETRAAICWVRLQAQRRARGATIETAADLRWYLAERKKIAKRFDELAEVYHTQRAKIDRECSTLIARGI